MPGVFPVDKEFLNLIEHDQARMREPNRANEMANLEKTKKVIFRDTKFWLQLLNCHEYILCKQITDHSDSHVMPQVKDVWLNNPCFL